MFKKILISLTSFSLVFISAFSFSSKTNILSHQKTTKNLQSNYKKNNLEETENIWHSESVDNNLTNSSSSKSKDILKTKSIDNKELEKKELTKDDFIKLYRITDNNTRKFQCTDVSSNCSFGADNYYFDDLNDSLKNKIQQNSDDEDIDAAEDGIVSLTIQNLPLSGVVSGIKKAYASFDKQILLSSIIKNISFIDNNNVALKSADFNISSSSFNASLFQNTNNSPENENNFLSMSSSGDDINNYNFLEKAKSSLSSNIDFLNFNHSVSEKDIYGTRSLNASLNSSSKTSLDLINFNKTFNKSPASIFNNYISFTFNKPVKLSSVSVLINSYKDSSNSGDADNNLNNYSSVTNLVDRNKFDEIGSIIYETSKNIVYRADNVSLNDLNISENDDQDNYIKVNLLPRTGSSTRIWSVYSNVSSLDIYSDSIISIDRLNPETLDFWYDKDQKTIKNHIGFSFNDTPLRDYRVLNKFSTSDYLYSPISAVDRFKYSTLKYPSLEEEDHEIYFSNVINIDADKSDDSFFANSYSCFFDPAQDPVNKEQINRDDIQDLELFDSFLTQILEYNSSSISTPLGIKDSFESHEEDIARIYSSKNLINNLDINFSGRVNNLDKCSMKNLKIFSNFLDAAFINPLPLKVDTFSVISNENIPYSFISVSDIDSFVTNFQGIRSINIGNNIAEENIIQEKFSIDVSSGSKIEFDSQYYSEPYNSKLFVYGSTVDMANSYRSFSQSLEQINFSNLYIGTYNLETPLFYFKANLDGSISDLSKDTQFLYLSKNILPTLRKGVKIYGVPSPDINNTLLSNAFDDEVIKEDSKWYKGYIFDRLYYNRKEKFDSVQEYVNVSNSVIERAPDNTLIVLEKTAEQTYPQPSIDAQDPTKVDHLTLDFVKIKPTIFSYNDKIENSSSLEYIWNFRDSEIFNTNEVDPNEKNKVNITYSWVNVLDKSNPVYYFTEKYSEQQIKSNICKYLTENSPTTDLCGNNNSKIKIFNVSPVVSGSDIVKKYHQYNEKFTGVSLSNYVGYKEKKYNISSKQDRDKFLDLINKYKIYENNSNKEKKYQIYNGIGFLNSSNVDNYKILLSSGNNKYYYTDISYFLKDFASSNPNEYFNFSNIKLDDNLVVNLPDQSPNGGYVIDTVKNWNKNWLIKNNSNPDLPKFNYKSLWAAFDPKYSYNDTFYESIRINGNEYSFSESGIINQGRQVWNIPKVTTDVDDKNGYIVRLVESSVDGSDNISFSNKYFTDMNTFLSTSQSTWQFTTLADPGDIILSFAEDRDFSSQFIEYIDLGNIPRQYNKNDTLIKGRFPTQSDTKYNLERNSNNLFTNNPYLKPISYAVLNPRWKDIDIDSQEKFDEWVKENVFNPDATGHNTINPKKDFVRHASLINGNSYFIIDQTITNPSTAISQFYDQYKYTSSANFYNNGQEYNLFFYFTKDEIVSSDNELKIPNFSNIRFNLNSLAPMNPKITPPSNPVPKTPMPSLSNSEDLIISDSNYGQDVSFSAYKSFNGWLWGRIESNNFVPMTSSLIKGFNYISNGHLYSSVYDIPTSNTSPISSVYLPSSANTTFWDTTKNSDFYVLRNTSINANIIDLATNNSIYEVDKAKGLESKTNEILIGYNKKQNEDTSETESIKKKLFLYEGKLVAEETELQKFKYASSLDGNFSTDFSWSKNEIENTNFFTSSTLVNASEEPLTRSVINYTQGPRDFRFLDLPVIRKPKDLNDKLVVRDEKDLIVYSIKPTQLGEKIVWQNPIDLSTLRFVDKDGIYYLALDKNSPSKYDDREISSVNIARSFLLEISEDIKVNDSTKNQLIILIIAGSVLLTTLVGSLAYLSIYTYRSISNRKKVLK
jgi:hypothetical protein